MHENMTCSPYVLYAQMAIYTHFFFVSPGMAAFAQQDQHINEFSLNISCVLRGKVRDVNDIPYYASFRYLCQLNYF